MDNQYTLFWLTGESQLISGITPTDAFNNNGIGNGALRALDFWSEGDKRNSYEWDKSTRSWKSTHTQDGGQEG